MSRIGVLRAGLVFGVLAALPFGLGVQWVMNMLIFTVMYAGLASAWNLVGGITGYPSLGHAAFFGIGAYAVAIRFDGEQLSTGYEPFLLLPLVGLGVGLLGVLVGWVAMRTRSGVFAIVTVTLLFLVQALAFNLHALTGGSQGLSLPVPPFDVAIYEWPFFYAMLALLALAVAVNWLVLGSKLGLSLRAIRADEDKARGLGVHVTTAKLVAFSVSVGITGMIGGVWAYYVSFVYPQFAIDPLVTIGLILMAYLGGRGTVWGPVLGAFIIVPAQQYLAYRLGASQLYLVGYAAVFLGIMLLLPRGVLPTLADRRRRRQAAGESSPQRPELPVPQGAG